MNQHLNKQKVEIIKNAHILYNVLVNSYEKEVQTNNFLSDKSSKKIIDLSNQLGIFSSHSEIKHGGKSLDPVTNIKLQEILGGTFDVLTRRAYGNSYEFMKHGSQKQIDQYLIPSIQGKKWGCFALTETGSGSDIANIKTTAKLINNKWIINGQKDYISDVKFSDFIVLAAKSENELKNNKISLFLINTNNPKIKINHCYKMMGFKGTTHSKIIFDNVEIPYSALLGQKDQGQALISKSLSEARLYKVGARGVGKCIRLLRLMIERSKKRYTFGKPIIEHGEIKDMIITSLMEVKLIRSFLYETANKLKNGLDISSDISILKIKVSETFFNVADRALQIFGASGCHESSIIENMFNDARLFRIIDGTTEIHKKIIYKKITNELVDIGSLIS